MKSYLSITILIFLICSCNVSHAQWVKLNQDSVQYYSTVYFLNPDTGFITGKELIDPYSGVILRTLDGGNSWDTTKIIWGFMTDIQFINDSIGFAGGQDGVIVKTMNMGATWNLLGHCQWTSDFSNFYFLNSDTAFVHSFGGSIRLFTNNPPGCTGIFNPWAESYFPGTGELDFLNYTDGFVAGGYGIFARTFDRGATWNFYNCDTSLYILGAKMIDTNNTVLVGKHAKVTKTTDGGITWTVPISLGPHDIMDIDFYNNQYGFAVGGFNSPNYWPSSGWPPIGIIWSTSDGGNSWALVDSSYSEQLTDIHIVNDSLAFAVGLNGLVLRNQSHFSTINNIQGNNENMNFSIYPNPFSEEINISLATAISENHITLFDLSGKLIESHKFTGNNYRINASHLSKGVYFIKIISDNEVATRKLVKLE